MMYKEESNSSAQMRSSKGIWKFWMNDTPGHPKNQDFWSLSYAQYKSGSYQEWYIPLRDLPEELFYEKALVVANRSKNFPRNLFRNVKHDGHLLIFKLGFQINKMKKSLALAFALVTLLGSSGESRSVTLAEKEVECFSQSKIYHRESDKCYKLLTRGPCESGEWFVLEKPRRTPYGTYPDASIHAVCVREKCSEGGLFWPKTKTCVQAKDKSVLCGGTSDEELLNNVFGEGECMCARDPLRARVEGDESSRCYQLYTRGPCRREEVLGASFREPGKATCIVDRCLGEKLKRQREGTLPRDAVLAPWTNGTCYELGTQGPCPDTLKFKVDETNLQPNCVSLTNAIFDLERPMECFQDENGDCQHVVNAGKKQSAEKYKKELLSSLSALRKRRQLSRD